MQDEYLLKGARKALVENLKKKGITDELVLNAMLSVERHQFLESFLWHKAYEDIPLPIYCDQTISQPYTVAFQSQLLSVKKDDKILEIGTGSGYQAAILDAMGAKVFTVERYASLYEHSKSILNKIAPRVITYLGDGFKGFQQYAPYDKIIVTCGAPEIPTKLLEQLKIGGMMVVPVGVGEQIMMRITKMADDDFKQESFGLFVFVPMLENIVK